MAAFLTTYFSVYGGMTAVAVYRLHRGLGGPARYWWAFGLFAASMVFLPLLLHAIDGARTPGLARALSLFCFTWLAWVFWFDSLQLAVWLWNLAVAGLAYADARLAALSLGARPGVLASLGALLGFCVWGFAEAGNIRLKTVELGTARLSADTAPVRLVQISDLHVGRTSRPGVLSRVRDLVREAAPDVLVSSGDLVDATDPSVEEWGESFADIRPPLGKYAVLGNHEVYAGAGHCVQILRRAGFVVLRGESAAAGPVLTLVGVDDPAERGPGTGSRLDEAAALPETVGARFVVLLKHRPLVGPVARIRSDLQLSGHTHDGQIFPFGWIVAALYPYPHSRPVWASDRLRVYVSRGTGTWGPPLRLFAPPEVTLFLIRGTGTGM